MQALPQAGLAVDDGYMVKPVRHLQQCLVFVLPRM